MSVSADSSRLLRKIGLGKSALRHRRLGKNLKIGWKVPYRLQKSRPFSPSDPEWAMGPLSRTDEHGYREYLRNRLMECFGPEDRVLTWSLDRLLRGLWTLKFYRTNALDIVKRASSLTLGFGIHDDGTLERRLAEIKRELENNKPMRYADTELLVTHDSARDLSHSLEVIESYRPGLGQRLSQVARDLLIEPLEPKR